MRNFWYRIRSFWRPPNYIEPILAYHIVDALVAQQDKDELMCIHDKLEMWETIIRAMESYKGSPLCIDNAVRKFCLETKPKNQ